MKYILLIALLATLASNAENIPDSFIIEKNWSNNNFSTSNGGEIKYKVSVINPTYKYELRGQTVAYARINNKINKNVISVFDETDVLIGTIVEFFNNSFFGMEVIYYIYDSNNKVIYKSKKDSYLITAMSISDDQGTCYINRNCWGCKDTWFLDFNNCKIDRRVIMFIPVFKTYNYYDD